MSNLSKSLKKELWKHELFPQLLSVVEELPTWRARANALNAAGLTTFHEKPWTYQNVHRMFQSYWRDGAYSWNETATKLRAIAELTT